MPLKIPEGDTLGSPEFDGVGILIQRLIDRRKRLRKLATFDLTLNCRMAFRHACIVREFEGISVRSVCGPYLGDADANKYTLKGERVRNSPDLI